MENFDGARALALIRVLEDDDEDSLSSTDDEEIPILIADALSMERKKCAKVKDFVGTTVRNFSDTEVNI